MQKKNDSGRTKSAKEETISKNLIYYLRSVKLISMKCRIQLIAIFLYTILTILFTYPIAFSKNAVAGYGDVTFYLWDIWWIKESIFSFSTPYWTPYLFYPSGLSLAFSTITPLNGIISIPFQFFFDLISTYNLLWLLSFIIAGYGTYLLVYYFTKNTYASFISGLIFMFSPYHFAHGLGHLSLLSIQWIPFYILYLFKTIKERSYKNAIIAAIFLILIGISDNTYLLYVSCFTFILLLFYLITEKKIILQKDIIQRLITLVVVFTICFSPFIYPMLTEFMSTNQSTLNLGGFVTYSADILGFFIPSQLHPIFGKIVEPIYLNFTGNIAEYTIFAGYTVLFLAILAIIKIKSKEIKFWLISTVLFVILSLGPALHFNGIVTSTYEGINYAVPLPYLLIMHIPIISMARAPVRWDVMIMLTLSVLAGFGMAYLLNKYKNRSLYKFNLNKILICLVSLLILFEFLAVPFPMTEPQIPDVYNYIEDNEENYAILEVPGFNHPEYMYYQTFHNKYLITGYAHVPDVSWKFIQNNPAVYNLLMLNQGSETTITPQNDILIQDNDIGTSLLNYYNIRYILIHKNDLNIEQNTYIRNLMVTSYNDSVIAFNNSKYTLYKIPNQSTKTFIALDEGWSGRELWNNIPTRWMTDKAQIIIYSNEDQISTLNMQAISFCDNRTLNISSEDFQIEENIVPTDFINISVPIKFHKGENIIYFNVLEGCERPKDLPGLDSTDSRCLSLAVQNISLN